MLNLVDLCSLLMLVTNPVLCCMTATKAHWRWSAIGLSIGAGLVVGVLGAECSRKLSYRIAAIESGGRGWLEMILFLGYMLAPLAFLAGSLWTSHVVGGWVARLL